MLCCRLAGYGSRFKKSYHKCFSSGVMFFRNTLANGVNFLLYEIILDTSSTATRSAFPRRGWLTHAVCCLGHLKNGFSLFAPVRLGKCARGAGGFVSVNRLKEVFCYLAWAFPSLPLRGNAEAIKSVSSTFLHLCLEGTFATETRVRHSRAPCRLAATAPSRRESWKISKSTSPCKE